MLSTHEKVLDDPLRVRLTGFSREGFKLDIHAYIATTDYAEFLEIAEELNLATIEIVTKSGTGFAIPGLMLAPGEL